MAVINAFAQDAVDRAEPLTVAAAYAQCRAAALAESVIGPAGSGAYGTVDGPAGCWPQRDQNDLGALAAYPQHPVAVFLAEVSDVRAGGLENPQAQQA
jgi:hypothetical protein